jgi:hypothetical protein
MMMRLTVTAKIDNFVGVRFPRGKTAQAVALIEAAPDLLAALQWALAQIEDSLDPDHRAALESARAAVARATGDQ